MTARQMIDAIPPESAQRFQRDDAILDIERDRADGFSIRQGGRAGIWLGVTREELALLMGQSVDEFGPWLPQS